MTKTNEEIIRQYIRDNPIISVKLSEDLIREAKREDFERMKKQSQPIFYQLKTKEVK